LESPEKSGLFFMSYLMSGHVANLTNFKVYQMRNSILSFLRDLPAQQHEQFNQAFDLYRKSPGARSRYIQSLNTQGFSGPRLNDLLYELKKLHSITEKELLLPPTDVQESAEEVTEPVPADDQSTDSSDNTITLETVFTKAPDTVKTEVKLRDEFPFLSAPDCPDEFKILVADKMTHYGAYVAAHNELLKVVPEEGEDPVSMNDDEIFALAKLAVQNFIINQDIYAELNAYKTTGKILGKHPVFIAMKRKETIDALSPKQLVQKETLLVNYINRNKAELARTVDAERKEKLQDKITGWEIEQKLVAAKLAEYEKQ
jgi:hypothetical protein